LFSDPPSAPGLPEIVDWDETMVKLKWEPPIRDGGAPITGDFSVVLCMFQTTTVKPCNYFMYLVRCKLYAWKGIILKVLKCNNIFKKCMCVLSIQIAVVQTIVKSS